MGVVSTSSEAFFDAGSSRRGVVTPRSLHPSCFAFFRFHIVLCSLYPRKRARRPKDLHLSLRELMRAAQNETGGVARNPSSAFHRLKNEERPPPEGTRPSSTLVAR